MDIILKDAYVETIDGVTYTLDLEEEDHPPEEDFEEQSQIDYVRGEIAKGNLFAFFCAKVTARAGGCEGVHYFGSCSYKDAADFCQEGGYWPQLKADALAELKGELESAVAAGKKASEVLCHWPLTSSKKKGG